MDSLFDKVIKSHEYKYNISDFTKDFERYLQAIDQKLYRKSNLHFDFMGGSCSSYDFLKFNKTVTMFDANDGRLLYVFGDGFELSYSFHKPTVSLTIIKFNILNDGVKQSISALHNSILSRLSELR